MATGIEKESDDGVALKSKEAVVVRLQSFIRGCQTRSKVSNMVDQLIADMIVQMQQENPQEATNQEAGGPTNDDIDKHKQKDVDLHRIGDHPTKIATVEESGESQVANTQLEQIDAVVKYEETTKEDDSSKEDKTPKETKETDVDAEGSQTIRSTLDSVVVTKKIEATAEKAIKEEKSAAMKVKEEARVEDVRYAAVPEYTPTLRETKKAEILPFAVRSTANTSAGVSAPSPVDTKKTDDSNPSENDSPPKDIAASKRSSSIQDRKKAFWSAASKPTVATSVRKLQIQQEQQEHPVSSLPKKNGVYKKPDVVNRYQLNDRRSAKKGQGTMTAVPIKRVSPLLVLSSDGTSTSVIEIVPGALKRNVLDPDSKTASTATSTDVALKKETSSGTVLERYTSGSNNEPTKKVPAMKKESNKKSVLDRFPVASQQSEGNTTMEKPGMTKEPSKPVLNRYTNSSTSNHGSRRTSNRHLRKSQSEKAIGSRYSGAIGHSSDHSNRAVKQAMPKAPSTNSVFNRYKGGTANSTIQKTNDESTTNGPSSKRVLEHCSGTSTARPTDFPRQRSKKWRWHPYGNDDDKTKIDATICSRPTDFPKQRSQKVAFHPFGEKKEKETIASHPDLTIPSQSSKIVKRVDEAQLLRTFDNMKDDDPIACIVQDHCQPATAAAGIAAAGSLARQPSNKIVLERFTPAPTSTSNSNPSPLANIEPLSTRYNPSTTNTFNACSSRNIALPGKRRNDKLAWSVFGEQACTSSRKIKEQDVLKRSEKLPIEEPTNCAEGTVQSILAVVLEGIVTAGAPAGAEHETKDDLDPSPPNNATCAYTEDQGTETESSEKDFRARFEDEDKNSEMQESEIRNVCEKVAASHKAHAIEIDSSVVDAVTVKVTSATTSNETPSESNMNGNEPRSRENSEMNDTKNTTEEERIPKNTEDMAPLVASPDFLDWACTMPSTNARSALVKVGGSVCFDDSCNVAYEYEADVAAKHTDRLPLWWMQGVPHDTLEEHEKDSNIDIGYFLAHIVTTTVESAVAAEGSTA